MSVFARIEWNGGTMVELITTGGDPIIYRSLNGFGLDEWTANETGGGDGVWGFRTERAARQFAKKRNITIVEET